MLRILIVNGVNLNVLGKREPHIYGTQTFEDFFTYLQKRYPAVVLTYFQSNYEGALVDRLQQTQECQGIILNAGAYTHTSIALRDTVAMLSVPVIEVHISNIYKRETFRHCSFLSAVCAGSIVGLGIAGYELALQYFIIRKTPLSENKQAY